MLHAKFGVLLIEEIFVWKEKHPTPIFSGSICLRVLRRRRVRAGNGILSYTYNIHTSYTPLLWIFTDNIKLLCHIGLQKSIKTSTKPCCAKSSRGGSLETSQYQSLYHLTNSQALRETKHASWAKYGSLKTAAHCVLVWIQSKLVWFPSTLLMMLLDFHPCLLALFLLEAAVDKNCCGVWIYAKARERYQVYEVCDSVIS